ncbi:hypothetical protein TCAL_07158 [Tigriopus californicus]|uniref:Lebercilin domain-containing protein n=1 Tax=Tigriopus californicus TaxID=6832 RepID=A0A553NEX8_TIGCA|nr:ELKS/Rab6-interacting/CAST family member 1-like [Tigriopus californicus]TRY64002.1 hypothetical protein TCAL_07158 [Tigriopus californicus]
MSFHGALKELEELEAQLRDSELQILQVSTRNAVLQAQLNDKNQQIRDARLKVEELDRVIHDENEKIRWIDQATQAKQNNMRLIQAKLPELERQNQDLKAKKETEIERLETSLKRKRDRLAQSMAVWSGHPQFEYWSTKKRNVASVDEEIEEVLDAIQKIREEIKTEKEVWNRHQAKRIDLDNLRMEHQGQKDQLAALDRERAQLDQIWNDEIQAQVENRHRGPRESSVQPCSVSLQKEQEQAKQLEPPESMDTSEQVIDLSSRVVDSSHNTPGHTTHYGKGTPKPSPNSKWAKVKVTPKRPSLSALFAATPSPKTESSLSANKIPNIGKLSLPAFPKLNPPRTSKLGSMPAVPIIFPMRPMGDALRATIKSNFPPLNLKLNMPKTNLTNTKSPLPQVNSPAPLHNPAPNSLSPDKSFQSGSKEPEDPKHSSQSTNDFDSMKFAKGDQPISGSEKEFQFAGFEFRANDGNASASNFNMEGRDFTSIFGGIDTNGSEKKSSAGEDPFSFAFNF